MKTFESYLEQVTKKGIEQIVDALQQLVNFSDVFAVTAIQNAFFHYKPEVRQAAAQAAGENLDESLLDALINLLKEGRDF